MANESAWGQKPSGKNNYFGMKATLEQDGTIRTTHEGYGKNRIKIEDRFLDYSNLNEGIRKGIERLHNKFNAFSVPVNQYAHNLRKHSYFTDDPIKY